MSLICHKLIPFILTLQDKNVLLWYIFALNNLSFRNLRPKMDIKQLFSFFQSKVGNIRHHPPAYLSRDCAGPKQPFYPGFGLYNLHFRNQHPKIDLIQLVLFIPSKVGNTPPSSVISIPFILISFFNLFISSRLIRQYMI